MIARPQQLSSRLFPVPTNELYTQASGLEVGTLDQRFTSDFLLLSKLDFTRGQHFFAPKMSPQTHLARLLMQHRLGLESELAAQWLRADFFWKQVQIQLKALSKRKDLWQLLAIDISQKHPDIEVLSETVSLQQRLVNELLIDTHCGFYNGFIQASQAPETKDSNSKELRWSDRAFVHIRYIEQLLPYSSLSQQEVQSFLYDSWQQQINLCGYSKNWAEVIGLCRNRLIYCPDFIPFQDSLAEMQANAIISGLTNGKNEKQQIQDAKSLQRGIELFENLAQAYPHNAAMLDYLGNLNHLHAIRLGNSGLVAEGLVAVEKALIYTPYLQDAVLTRNNLAQAMEQLNEYANQLKAQLAQHHGSQLNAQGQKIISQVKKGFKLRDKYLYSEQAKKVWKTVQTAQAVEIWRNIGGLPDPPNEKQAIALLTGLNKVLEHPPIDKVNLPDAWQAVVKENPELADLNDESIQTFLEKRIWEIERASPIITPPPKSGSSFVNKEFCVLRPISLEAQPSSEPFLPWVFSRQDLRLKAQTAIAMIALLLVSGLGLYDSSVRATRETAYGQLVNTDPQSNSEDVITAAEKFLSHSPLSGKDAREEQVKDLYAKAFVSWFLQQPKALDNKTGQARLERYQSLTRKE